MITKETAAKIWTAHQQIEKAHEMKEKIEEANKWGKDPTPIDNFGRKRGYSLGVPSGDSGERLLSVDPGIVPHIIDAHVAVKRKELEEACVMARIELAGETVTDTVTEKSEAEGDGR